MPRKSLSASASTSAARIPANRCGRTISADTICIHSDSAIALDLAIRLRRLIET